MHTLLSTVCLLGALLSDSSLHTSRLYPHESLVLYLDISMSLGYFTYSLPMSVVMAEAGFPYGSYLMIAHHTLVFGAQSTFLLTQYPSGYMAASGFLFELTNVFFVPHVIMLQLGVSAALRNAVGAMLVVVYTGGRCVLCTALGIARHSLQNFVVVDGHGREVSFEGVSPALRDTVTDHTHGILIA